MRLVLLLTMLILSTVRAGHPVSTSDTSWPFTVSSSLLPSGIWLRWRASDLSSSPVSSWSDEIQNWTWVQATGGNKPTWSTNGVAFNGSGQFMTTSNFTALTQSTNQSWLIVSKFNSTSGGKILLGVNCGGGNIFFGASSGALYDGNGNSISPAPVNILYDFLLTKTGTNTWQVYTNGISAWSHNYGLNDGTIVNHLSLENSTGCTFDGLVQEILVWTNNLFTSSQVSNIHHYATNTYGFSP